MAAAERVLASTVHVDGAVYEAGASVPAEVAKLITNPKAWADGSTLAASASGEAEEKAAAEAKAKDEAEAAAKAAAEATSGSGSGGPEKPPVKGKGSGKEPWADYAKAVGISVPEEANAEAIQVLVAEHEAKA